MNRSVILLVMIMWVFASLLPSAWAAAPASQLAGLRISGTTRGLPNAPVTVDVFYTYRCAGSMSFTQSVVPKLDEYAAQGKVYLVYHHKDSSTEAYYPSEAYMTSKASECAAEQNQFWPFVNRIYISVSKDPDRELRPEVLRGFAEELGLDVASFDECLDSDGYLVKLRQDNAAARRLGALVSGTPKVYINGGKEVGGDRAWMTLQPMIDAALGKIGK